MTGLRRHRPIEEIHLLGQSANLNAVHLRLLNRGGKAAKGGKMMHPLVETVKVLRSPCQNGMLNLEEITI